MWISDGALLNARHIVCQLEKKSVLTWNNMIAGIAIDPAESTLELLSRMHQEGMGA